MLTITTNPYLSHIFRLASCASVSIAGFWCPFIAGIRYAEYDNRMGFVIFSALPFLGLAMVFTIVLLSRLIRGLKTVRAWWRYPILFIGIILTIPSLLAIILVGVTFLIEICFLAVEGQLGTHPIL